MALRNGHGAGRGVTRSETLPVDELPAGVPSNADDASRAAATESGPFANGNRRSVLGGRARKGRSRMAERVALTPPSENLPTRRYHLAAKSFARMTATTLARTIGGGQLDAHVGYLVTAAARAAKWANYLSDLAERLVEGSEEQLRVVGVALSADEKASSHLRNAHEYAAKMADLRKRPGANGALPVWMEEVADGEEPKTEEPKT